jgi:ribosomal protein S18 acetylase RimI-like enzyme
MPVVFAVRDARPEDMEAIAEVNIEGWRVGYRGLVADAFLDGEFAEKRRAGWAERGLRIAREEPEEGLLALVAGGRVVGFAHVGAHRTPDGTATGEGEGELFGFYVHPTHWGTGAAGVLMEAAEERLRQLGFTDVVLYVFRDNPRARRFYEKAGWSSTGWEGSFDLEGQQIAEVRYGRTL